MRTLLRLAPVRFTTFGLLASFFALGCFDTVDAQNLTVSPNSLVFTAPQGGNPNPATQMITVGGNGNYIISSSVSSGGNWLFASTGAFNGTGGTAPDMLTVEIQSTSLASGTYTGTITLQPTSGTGAVTISVSLTVSGSGNTTSVLSATPSQLSFDYELGHSLPSSQTSQIVSSGIPLPFSFSINPGNTGPTTCPVGWLQAIVSTNSTPATLTVSIANPGGLGAGSCSGNVSITSTTTGNGTTTTSVGVYLFVSTGPVLNVAVPAGKQSVTLQSGAAPVSFNLQLTSSDTNNQLNFQAAATSSNNWLSINPLSGTTPASPYVQITPGIMSPGTYNGSITITSAGLFNGISNTLTIPVSMTVTSASSVTVTPSGTIGFNQAQGGTLPASQTVTLSGATSSNFTATASPQQNFPAWLQVTPTNGSMTPSNPATLTLSIAANTLLQGTYSSLIAINFTNSSIPSITIFVSLTVSAPSAALVPTPASLSFSYQTGGSPPSSQAITISNPATGSLPFTVASISDSWLAVTPSTGTTTGTLTVSVSPQNLQPGSYTGSFTLTSPGIASTTVNVTVFVSASTTPQPFIISNSASGIGNTLAPGEIISIKGSGLGPGTPVSFTLATLNNPTLAGVQVTFNGSYSGTLLYVSSTQINVIVPYEVASSTSVSIVVIYQGVASAAIVQPVGAVALGLFTDNATGSGQAAAVNSNYAYNTSASPALQGSYISVYATGGGQTNPASFDGEVTPPTSVLPLLAQQFVTATIGGRQAPILFAGAAPGYVTGVVQLNIQVPIGVTGSALPIVVTINGTPSQTSATVAVQ